MSDLVHHPAHYSASRFGVECIEFTRLMPFCTGNAFKYCFRNEDKGNPLQDMEKALVYGYWAHEGMEAAALPGKRDQLHMLYFRHLDHRISFDYLARILGLIIYEEWEEALRQIDDHASWLRMNGGES